MRSGHLFSSESVTEGHPDKLADQISDAVLDAMLTQDRNSRVACETLVTTGVVFVSGEITLAEGWVDIPSIVRGTVVDVETLLRPDVEAEVIDPVLREFPDLTTDGVRVLVNPTGRFEIGGPKADTGLTGRKIIVDSYGGMAPHGGGCFSGKDPTKVDRSAAYMARFVAKNLVAAGLADRLQLQVAYAIGTAHPVSLSIDTFGTHQVDPVRLVEVIREAFDFRP